MIWPCNTRQRHVGARLISTRRTTHSTGVTRRFSKRGDQFLCEQRWAGMGNYKDYVIKYTFGVYPLHNSISWRFPAPDAGAERGLGTVGQREGVSKVFHLYPKEKIDYKDELHWTSCLRTGTHMCCGVPFHQSGKRTTIRQPNQFRTRWSEINVSCEACHGPASQHVTDYSWPNKSPDSEKFAQKGLVLLLDERKGVNWAFSDTANTAARSQERSNKQGNRQRVPPCHSRRRHAGLKITGHGKSIMDSHLPGAVVGAFVLSGWPDKGGGL